MAVETESTSETNTVPGDSSVGPVSKVSLYLCMGSACHQYGVYHLLPIMQALLERHNLQGQVELKGAFCLGPCMDGIVLRVGADLLTDVNTANIEQKFTDEVLPRLTALINCAAITPASSHDGEQ